MAINCPDGDSRPRVSILTTSYNYGRFIRETIQSVLSQTYESWELIIVDDCSTDESWDVIRTFQDSRIRAVRQERNQGACAAYNRALRLATGDFIASLDSDDVFAPDKLAAQVAFLDANSDVDICGSYVSEIDASSALVNDDKCSYAPWFNQPLDLNVPDNWVWENHLCHSSVLVRKSLHDRIGLFREDLSYSPDWDFWLRSLADGAKFHVMPEFLLLYRAHGSNITHRNRNALMWEYADISGGVVHPYLERIGRFDLLQKSVGTFVGRFFEIDGDWRRFLELIEVLRWYDRHDDTFKIPPHLFFNDELTAFVTRLASGWSPKAFAAAQSRASNSESVRGHSAEGAGTREHELASTFLQLVRDERDQARAELAQMRIERDRIGVELDQMKAEIHAGTQREGQLAAELTETRAELDRIRGTVWGKADNLYRRLSR
ncbi:glycosyltransferase, group 2 family protein [Burkholderia ubonensis]|uniref:glycosyltransferase n=1 Tax=Burkholderia ubonensis TaxID=101571 RepID=UPI00075B5ACE|nr:glycosyltransferase [Burkholderia ubonensis]KUZ81168.1 glycosyltransferase, group 2 family protein [Burkholderia ubonensis]